MPIRSKIIEVKCQCRAVLFKYQKVGTGKLIKCYLSRILEDKAGIPDDSAIGTDIHCPQCKNRIGTIFGIAGVRAVKLNQGTIQPFRLD